MTWTPQHLTREQMEERRLKGAQLLKAGKLSQAEIARQLGVSRTAVMHWAQQLETGQPLQRRIAAGRPPKLTIAQQRTLKRLLKRGACAAGFSTERWTLERIQQVIEREFGITYHEHSLSDVLAGLGWSLQQPLARAQERDEDIIQAWLEQDWPRIKKGAATWRRHRVFR
jgi:putative transposase